MPVEKRANTRPACTCNTKPSCPLTTQSAKHPDLTGNHREHRWMAWGSRRRGARSTKPAVQWTTPFPSSLLLLGSQTRQGPLYQRKERRQGQKLEPAPALRLLSACSLHRIACSTKPAVTVTSLTHRRRCTKRAQRQLSVDKRYCGCGNTMSASRSASPLGGRHNGPGLGAATSSGQPPLAPAGSPLRSARNTSPASFQTRAAASSAGPPGSRRATPARLAAGTAVGRSLRAPTLCCPARAAACGPPAAS